MTAPRENPASPPGTPEPEANPLSTRTRSSGVRRSRGIRILQPVLVVLACLGIMASSVSIWAHRTVFNTDRWVATVAPLATNQDVVTAVSGRVTQEVQQAVQPERVAQNLLPSRLKGLAAPIAQGFDQIVASTVSTVMRSAQFSGFWIALNRQLQPRVAAALLQQPTKRFLTANGTIQLNLLPLVSKALIAVQKKAPSLFPKNASIPEITPNTPPDQARAELSFALGRALPSNFGTRTLLRSSQLSAAQNVVSLVNKLILAVVILTAVMIPISVLLAQRRRRTIVALAVGTLVAMAIAVALTKVISNQIVKAIINPQDRRAILATTGTVFGQLDAVIAALMGAALLLVVIAFLSGSSRAARAARRQTVAVGRSMVGQDKSLEVPRALVLLHRLRLWFVLAGLAIGFVLLVTLVQGWISLLVLVLVVGAYEGLVLWGARRAASEDPGLESQLVNEAPIPTGAKGPK